MIHFEVDNGVLDIEDGTEWCPRGCIYEDNISEDGQRRGDASPRSLPFGSDFVHILLGKCAQNLFCAHSPWNMCTTYV